MYRGAPDSLGSGTVGETQRVDDRAGYDQALKDGWRKERHDDDHPDESAGDSKTAAAGDDKKAAAAKSKK